MRCTVCSWVVLDILQEGGREGGPQICEGVFVLGIIAGFNFGFLPHPVLGSLGGHARVWKRWGVLVFGSWFQLCARALMETSCCTVRGWERFALMRLKQEGVAEKPLSCCHSRYSAVLPLKLLLQS